MADSRLPEKDTEITLKTAQGWVASWKKATDDDLRKKKVDSYLIPKINLEKVLEQGIDAARAYIGINEDGLQTLMIVGTRYDEKTGIYVDMVPRNGVEEGGGDGIYDFAQPSPPATGDDSSPMNQ
ncbi:hypothetical protein SAMN05444397_103510 [Flavobacterium aquidurense]|uniref:Uncharacterized protein n=1 Tax=Flavobacterium frigidimaris TaxID=262320 RepID=A0ABX4BM55_FLAFR|nr:hypothetical protein [Flavobacterium frigidimaris]OXA77351.1 hypothetical protein B0A65_17015 [Flavobacterium frigidimaris]SDZ12141.1 hypothetical protein SAMN05444397_103510 [Flavobacterium aquidurense]